jgi:hypothetical protein
MSTLSIGSGNGLQHEQRIAANLLFLETIFGFVLVRRHEILA